jgi:GNAT superfamily N-acetyltransferase
MRDDHGTGEVPSLLAALDPDPAHVEKLMLYGRFVGSWRVAATWFGRDGTTRTANGEWHFAWILGGRGMQDVLFAEGASPDRFGTTLRCYDAALDAWHITWMCPASGEFNSLVGRRVGDRIVQEGPGQKQGHRIRWSFTEMAGDSFVWLGEVSADGGATWFLEQEMRATRFVSEAVAALVDPRLVEVVPAADGDYEFSYQVKKAAEGALITQVFGWDEAFQREYHLREWRQRRPSLITVGGRAVGTVELADEDGARRIGQFFVLPEFQNRGIGSEILVRVLRQADDAGQVTRLALLAGNRCESLYRRHGFEVNGEDGALRFMERKRGGERA